MSERITNKQVEGLFRTLVKACGKHVATSYKDVGGWELEYNAAYGGWQIREIVNESGGASDPLGSTRRKNTEMWSTMHFALRVLESCRGGRGHGDLRRRSRSRRSR